MGLKIEDLNVGDELVCIDFKGLADHRHDYMSRWLYDLMLSPIIVSNVNIGSNTVYFRNDSRYLDVSDFKYFKKKEQSQQYTFDDLIDVAVQAVKDGVIAALVVNKGGIEFTSISDRKYYAISSRAFTSKDIDVIQSLYTEEFVIETMSDELKIKSGAQLILSNGMKCIYFDDGERKLRHDGDYYPCNFLVLKGATVTQSK